MVPKQRDDNMEVSLTAMSSPRTHNTDINGKLEKSNKRGRKMSERTKKKQAKRTMCEALSIQADPERVAECAIHEKELNDSGKSLHLNKRTRKGDKKVMFDSSAAESVPETVSTFSVEANPLNFDNKTMVTDLQPSTDQKKSSMESVDRKQPDLPKRSRNKTNSKYQELRCSNKQKISTIDISKGNNVNGIQDGFNEVAVKSIEPEGKLQYKSEVGGLQAKKMEKAPQAFNEVVLRKCETAANKIQCAFCHSREDSEVL